MEFVFQKAHIQRVHSHDVLDYAVYKIRAESFSDVEPVSGQAGPERSQRAKLELAKWKAAKNLGWAFLLIGTWLFFQNPPLGDFSLEIVDGVFYRIFADTWLFALAGWIIIYNFVAMIIATQQSTRSISWKD